MTAPNLVGVEAAKAAADAAWNKLRDEYEFMRSFGMTHQRACKAAGTTVDAFGAVARRRGYTYKP